MKYIIFALFLSSFFSILMVALTEIKPKEKHPATYSINIGSSNLEPDQPMAQTE